jgi:uncharacterized protein YndB with AHSA1/START domain
MPCRADRGEVDGYIRFDIEDSGVEFFVVGQFEVLDRPRQLSFTWQCSTWPDPEIWSVVTVSFARQGLEETLMTIDHTLLPPELVKQHRRGWAAIAHQLGDVLSRTARGRGRSLHDSL